MISRIIKPSEVYNEKEINKLKSKGAIDLSYTVFVNYQFQLASEYNIKSNAIFIHWHHVVGEFCIYINGIWSGYVPLEIIETIPYKDSKIYFQYWNDCRIVDKLFESRKVLNKELRLARNEREYNVLLSLWLNLHKNYYSKKELLGILTLLVSDFNNNTDLVVELKYFISLVNMIEGTVNDHL